MVPLSSTVVVFHRRAFFAGSPSVVESRKMWCCSKTVKFEFFAFSRVNWTWQRTVWIHTSCTVQRAATHYFWFACFFPVTGGLLLQLPHRVRCYFHPLVLVFCSAGVHSLLSVPLCRIAGISASCVSHRLGIYSRWLAARRVTCVHAETHAASRGGVQQHCCFNVQMSPECLTCRPPGDASIYRCSLNNSHAALLVDITIYKSLPSHVRYR